jgi:hypothetical protein
MTSGVFVRRAISRARFAARRRAYGAPYISGFVDFERRISGNSSGSLCGIAIDA